MHLFDQKQWLDCILSVDGDITKHSCCRFIFPKCIILNTEYTLTSDLVTMSRALLWQEGKEATWWRWGKGQMGRFG